MEGFEAILAVGHMGVVVLMVESCVHWEEKQNELLQRLLQVHIRYSTDDWKQLTTVLMLYRSAAAWKHVFNDDEAIIQN